ncbi:MAG: DUF4340 domain-containing protein [Beijerinckiaceae bacterium]
MNAKYVLALAVVAAAAVAGAAITRPVNPARLSSDKRGTAVFPDLLNKANSVATITVRDKDKAFTVVRTKDSFTEQTSGYAVKDDIFRDLVAAAATLSYEEAKTADEKRYEDLGLADPEKVKTDKAGRLVTLKDDKGLTLASFYAGNRESNVGGARGGQYIRLPDDKRAWLVRGAANVPAPHTAWYEINLINLNKQALAKVDISGGGMEELKFESANKDADLKLLNPVPEGRKENTTNTLRVAFMMDPISFDDVRKTGTEVKPDARKIVAMSRDGLKITITNLGELKDGWVRIEAEATTDKAKKEAEELK